MPPAKKLPGQLGDVQPHGGGWRVYAKIDGKTYTGPTRPVQSQAQRDLARARRCNTRDLMRDSLQNLHASAQQEGQSLTVNAYSHPPQQAQVEAGPWVSDGLVGQPLVAQHESELPGSAYVSNIEGEGMLPNSSTCQAEVPGSASIVGSSGPDTLSCPTASGSQR